MKKMFSQKFLVALTAVALMTLIVSGASSVYAQSKFTQEQLAYMPAVKLIELFKKGETTPSEVLEAQIARVKAYNGEYNVSLRDLVKELDTFNAGKVNAITFDKFAEARAQAKEADERYRKGTARKLEGITVGVKDENEVKGWRVDYATIPQKDHAPCQSDGAMIEKLRDEGAIFVFQTTVPELYLSPMTWSRLYGVTRNPWNLYYGVGGSSGGSGAALAAGFCTLATGSDMGGSIRIPSSMNGVYGFKPPFGRVATSNNAYETYGPMTRTFADMVLMQNVIVGPSPKVHSSIRPKLDYPQEYASLQGQKVAVAYFKNWIKGGLSQESDHSLDMVTAALKKAGAQVETVEFDFDCKTFLPTYFKGLMSTNMYELFGSLQSAGDVFSSYVTHLFSKFGNLTPQDQVNADILLVKIHQNIQQKVFEKGCIALIMPTLATPHFPADLEVTPDKMAQVHGEKYPGENLMLTPIWNLASRYPVVTMPVELSNKNVPVGVQIVSNTYDDLSAFRVAYALSKTIEPLYMDGRFPDFRNAK
ncbi:MAG: amidase [Lachnospiraceae bacterium]|nr:amidase [Lachnospiraceae bacterium]